MIETKTIDGLMLREMAVAGAALLEKNRELVDALNVFPVPDGDTGTNMSLTMQSAVREISSKEYLRADEAAKALSKGALKGARGNSGVITSQLLRGFARALDGVEAITPVQFANALKAGSELAYKAVMKPKEGTILTVARVIAEDAIAQVAKDPDDYDALFAVMLRSGEAILKQTPEMLPVLKQAGVVDSGGRGLMFIYTGYAAALRGEDLAALLESEQEEEADEEENLLESKYAYCIDFVLSHTDDDCTEGEVDSLRRRLNRIGDHVQVSGSLEDRITIHAHTDAPGNALQFALELGEISEVQIQNINELKREKEEAENPPAPAEPEKEYGMVAVSLGEGFTQIFHDLTVDAIVEGGQTMNPSIDDILGAINSVNARCVYVFPNNGNVTMAAQQAAELAEKQVFVIPTKNVAMGIAAAVAFQPDASAEDNAARMEEASQHVRTATVTFAVRDSEYNGVTIAKDDIIGMYNGQITSAGRDVHDVALQMVKDIVTEDDSLITVYYGAETTESEAQALTEDVAAACPDCDVECHLGGQPLYYYLISVE